MGRQASINEGLDCCQFNKFGKWNEVHTVMNMNKNDCCLSKIPILCNNCKEKKSPVRENVPALVQIMVWCRGGYKALSEPKVVYFRTYICVTRLQSVTKADQCTWTMGYQKFKLKCISILFIFIITTVYKIMCTDLI